MKIYMNELHYQLDLLNAMNQKLILREQMYRNICDTVSNAFLYYNLDSEEVHTLGKWNEYFDITIKDIKEISKLFDLIDDEDVLNFRDAFYLEKSGKIDSSITCLIKDTKKWMNFRIHIITDQLGNPIIKVVSIEDITRYRMQKDELRYLAYYDSLTGLYNRNYFVSQLNTFIERAKKENGIVSVLIIDIDDFRKINDGMGLIFGDDLLQQLGLFFKEFTNKNIIASHFNSDVYCMAIYNPFENMSVEELYKKIRLRTNSPFRINGGVEVNITLSIGVAEYPEVSDNALELINSAEIVMFQGKNLGKNRMQYFTAPILDAFLNSIEIENRLKEAIFNNNFEMYYQPQFDAASKTLRGCEALIRWKDNDNHLISPGVFIPIAEKNGSIIPIGNWVVEQSIIQLSKWQKKYNTDIFMSINISAMQLKRDDFIIVLLDILKKYCVSPNSIELEITESILIDNFDLISDKIKALKNYGFKISLDDFGTGYSSLSYLKRLDIDTLKIDKTFIDTILSDSTTRIITESIINMAKALGFETVAEGVEEEQQYTYLHSIGCSTIQGYFFGRPVSAASFEDEMFKK